MVRFTGYAKKREPRWPYVGLAFLILMAAAVVLFTFSVVTQWLEAEANKPVTTTTTTVSTTVSTTTLAPATTTTSLAPVKKAETPVSAAAAATGIKVERIVIASGMESNQPVDDLAKVSAGEVGKLYCYTAISNSGNGQRIKHVWIGPNGKIAAEVELTARDGASATWSYINVAGLGTGSWQVRVEAEDGTVLAKKTFVTY